MKSILIQEVRVTAKRDKSFKKKWEIFKNKLLGQSGFTKDCEILNADVLRFEEDADGNLLVSFSEPFYVLNNALGYKIRIDMPFFKYNEKKWMGIVDQFFEKVTPINSEQEILWRKNRIIAFENSFRSFLVSLVKGNISENNYAILRRNILTENHADIVIVKEEIGKKICFLRRFLNSIFTIIKNTHTLFSNKELIVFLKNKKEENPILLTFLINMVQSFYHKNQ